MSFAKTKTIGFLGAGNMGSAIIERLVGSGHMKAEQILASNRTQRKLQKLVNEFGIKGFSQNEELVDQADVVVIGVKPQDVDQALEPISSSFREDQTVVSMASGVTLKSLEKVLGNVKNLVRIMPNTPVRIGRGVIGYCVSSKSKGADLLIRDLFAPLGYLVSVEEGESFEALTVACGSGVGFVFELMIYWSEWLEGHGFSPKVARKMTQEAFFGASQLVAESPDLSLQDLENRVTSKKGVTFAGLESMRELEIERALRYSFEKAVLRDRELGKLM